MISATNSHSPHHLLCTNPSLRASVFCWTRRVLELGKKSAFISGKVGQGRAGRDKHKASGSWESVTENALLSPLRWEGSKYRAGAKVLNCKEGAVGRMPRSTEKHYPRRLLKSPYLQRGLWWPEHTINKADAASTKKHKNLFQRTFPESPCMRPQLTALGKFHHDTYSIFTPLEVSLNI